MHYIGRLMLVHRMNKRAHEPSQGEGDIRDEETVLQYIRDRPRDPRGIFDPNSCLQMGYWRVEPWSSRLWLSPSGKVWFFLPSHFLFLPSTVFPHLSLRIQSAREILQSIFLETSWPAKSHHSSCSYHPWSPWRNSKSPNPSGLSQWRWLCLIHWTHGICLHLGPHAKASQVPGDFIPMGHSSQILASLPSHLFTYNLVAISALLSAATPMKTCGSYCPELCPFWNPPSVLGPQLPIRQVLRPVSFFLYVCFSHWWNIPWFPSLPSLPLFPFPSSLNSLVHHLPTVLIRVLQRNRTKKRSYLHLSLCLSTSIYLAIHPYICISIYPFIYLLRDVF